jgi:hypothetical protein
MAAVAVVLHPGAVVIIYIIRVFKKHSAFKSIMRHKSFWRPSGYELKTCKQGEQNDRKFHERGKPLGKVRVHKMGFSVL